VRRRCWPSPTESAPCLQCFKANQQSPLLGKELDQEPQSGCTNCEDYPPIEQGELFSQGQGAEPHQRRHGRLRWPVPDDHAGTGR
jgi:hypothetical protein